MGKIIDRTGETNIANNGQKMTIIDYGGNHNVTIQFEDGTIVYRKRYDYFKRGYIVNPNKRVPIKRNKNLIGKSNIANNGLKMTIIAARSTTDLDVQFENGEIVEHRALKEFKSGNIGCSNYGKYKDITSERIGETNIATNGQKMTIIAYRKANDIDIEFEDGYIAKHSHYKYFKSGNILNPNYTIIQKKHNDYIGKENIAKNGLKMTIIDYRGWNDIDIMFEDGIVVKHKIYGHFLKGTIKHPNITIIKDFRIGEQKINNDGLLMKIINYKTITDVDIQFETGYINRHKAYHNFLTGRIGHTFPYTMNNITIDKPAYVYKTIGNFYCTCNKCGKKDIMTIEEIKQHKCKKG